VAERWFKSMMRVKAALEGDANQMGAGEERKGS
jgi:hypothetical protein